MFQEYILRKTGGCGMAQAYAFEMAAGTIRYGRGVTRAPGVDLVDMGVKRASATAASSLFRLW